MKLNKKYLLLIALFVLLVSIPLTFATDSDDTAIQDSIDTNTIATQDTPTITETIPPTDENTLKKENTYQKEYDNNIKHDTDNINTIVKDIDSYNELIRTINTAKNDENTEYTFNLLEGDYNATDTIYISENDNLKTLTINGNGLTLDGGSGFQFFKIKNQEFTLNLNNMIIYNYHSSLEGGAINNIDGTVNIYNVTFLNNTSDNFGGAIYTLFGTYTIINSSFINNSVIDPENGQGGAIDCADYTKKLHVDNSIFINNYAEFGFDINSWATDLKINDYSELDYVEFHVKDKTICFDEDYHYHNYISCQYSEGIRTKFDKTLMGNVELILNNESLTTVELYSDYTITADKFNLGTNELKIIYSGEEFSQTISKTVIINKIDKKQTIMFMELPQYSSLNDNVSINYTFHNPDFEEISKGNVSVYVYNYTSKEYIKYKEVDVTDKTIEIILPEIISKSETYPQFFKYYIEYMDNTEEYNQYRLYDSFEVSNYNFTFIDDINYNQKTNTISFKVYDKTNNNAVVNTGKIRISTVVYDSSYTIVLTPDEIIANINQSNITLSNFDYNDFLGGEIKFELYYEDNRINKEFNNSYTSYYHSIRKDITVEVDNIEGDIGDVIILPIRIMDDENNNVDIENFNIWIYEN
ncbi:MAG: hypothetical protein Q4Q22_04670, partial [Methanosphaera sp.]|nr:hypothetical protein [Methanosphaera sp.]